MVGWSFNYVIEFALYCYVEYLFWSIHCVGARGIVNSCAFAPEAEVAESVRTGLTFDRTLPFLFPSRH